ncbi:PRMT5-domain-containing protein [Sistotremastrum niveocremeum HHB9708]|uniref:PRMT5-domain-containing protein n=1 Tax=Sistotremastrum niveocremeum HHB9708 TaxID=1314777 RepID=A0A164TUU7_9AGAM|nr:PRMT5-domain-containing protein [Sistotremastrum niveocremeum HHB9708]
MDSTPVALRFTLPELTQLLQSKEEKPDTSALFQIIEETRSSRYDSVCIPLTNDKWRQRWHEMCIVEDETKPRDPSAEQKAELWRSGVVAFKREEVIPTTLDEATSIIGLASDWIYLDSPDEWVRHDSELALLQELAYANYLSISNVILPPPRNREHVASYARAVNAALGSLGYTSKIQLSIRMPVYYPSVAPKISSETVSLVPPSEKDIGTSWEIWDSIRSICDSNPRLSISLDLTPPLPPSATLLQRWFGEPLRHVFLPAASFIPNAKGYPVLTKATQSFIRDVVKLRPTIILSQVSAKVHTAGGSSSYLQYVRHLEKTSPAIVAQETEGTVENFSKGWHDWLQAPLQPLQDNLGSLTYDIFERCPAKYDQYEKAVCLALLDRPPNKPINIYVVGAGRGPLVDCSFRALERSGRKASIFAVEKNPSAFVTLQERNQTSWSSQVRLIYGDMRKMPLPPDNEKADIIVSELLGSFGDNELSPECLDGVMRILKPNGTSIPVSYTAFLAPLSSSKLFHEVRSRDQALKDAETPYVVSLQAVNILSGSGNESRSSTQCGPKIQECWDFIHPRKDAILDLQGFPITNSHNNRSVKLKFHIPTAGTLHGFAGYFEAVLYGDIGLSIHPDRMHNISPNMTSWFPLFFPLKDALYLPENSELHVSIWRLSDKQRVWYEWHAENFLPVSVTAPEPRSPPRTASPPPAPRHGATLRPTTPGATISPLLDALSPLVPPGSPSPPPGGRGGRRSLPQIGTGPTKSTTTLVKIGQTNLHNPGGRSSWYGL